MKVSMDFLERKRGEFVYDLGNAEIPEGFLDWDKYDQFDWLEEKAFPVTELAHRNELEYDRAWISES